MSVTRHPSRSGKIVISMQFRTMIGFWDVAADRDGEVFGAKLFRTEDEAKGYANHLWATDGADDQPAPATPAEPHKDWFDVTGQSKVASNNLATDRQMSYLRSLIAERDFLSVGTDMRGQVAQVRDNPEFRPSNRAASEMIDRLKTTALASSVSSDGVHRDRQAPAPAPVQAAPLPDVPKGLYATESRTGNNDLDFWRVDRPTEGQWAGRTFVRRVIGGHEDQPVRGTEMRQALEAIVTAGPEQAARRYGQEIGRCGRCNRHLTDAESRAYGLGPDCRAKGW